MKFVEGNYVDASYRDYHEERGATDNGDECRETAGHRCLCGIPGYAHEFIASKNYLWLNPGESQIIEVNVDYPVCVKGWNIN